MNILAGNVEMYQWVEALFAEVPKETKDRWEMVKAPISKEMGTINIRINPYSTEFSIVGEFYDQEFKVLKDRDERFALEIRTIFKKKTILWSLDAENNPTVKIKHVAVPIPAPAGGN